MMTYAAVMPPLIRQGKGWKAYRPGPRPARALPLPYAVELRQTAHRDALTGRFAKTPGAVKGAVKLPARQATTELRFVRIVTVWHDGLTEVTGVRCRAGAARAARLRGELSSADLREFEEGLADDLLNELNPRARAEWELSQMHAAHRTDKARRGHVSKKRNAAARLKGKPQAPTFQHGASISISRAELDELLRNLEGNDSVLTVRVRKESGSAPRLEVKGSSIKLHTVNAS